MHYPTYSARQAKIQDRHELHKRLIDKFITSETWSEFELYAASEGMNVSKKFNPFKLYYDYVENGKKKPFRLVFIDDIFPIIAAMLSAMIIGSICTTMSYVLKLLLIGGGLTGLLFGMLKIVKTITAFNIVKLDIEREENNS